MRLIDADALIEMLNDSGVPYNADANYFVENAPTIKQKCGEWIDKGWKGDWQFETDGRGNCWYEYECSECGFRNKGSKSNFCPNCGAYMKGTDDE